MLKQSLHAITQQLGGEVSGNENTMVSKVGSLAYAEGDAISFFNDTRYTSQLKQTRASAVVLKPEHADLTELPVILTDNPYAYFAKLSSLLNPRVTPEVGIHASASIDASVSVPDRCSIAENVVVQAGVLLEEDVVIGPGTIIERNSHIGSGTILEANVTVKHSCFIGAHCHIFSGAVIGNDGFGYAEEPNADGEMHWVKIPQVGHVKIADHVDIGANTTVDRGAIDDTVIEEGVKIDNLVQIAHNCRIGAHTVIAGCVGIAGSAVIGRRCKIGGAAMILGHLNIADEVTISPGTMIMRSISKPGKYTALMPFQSHDNWLRTAANIRGLDKVASKIKQLEDRVKSLQNGKNFEESEK